MRARTIRMTALALALIGAIPAIAQENDAECPDGRAPVGELGIEEIRCSDRQCLIGFAFEGGRLMTTFTTEPRVHALRPPADSVLEEGDVIVSVDGKLSTTAEGSRRLAQIEPGDQVRLRVRRDGAERDVSITAIPSCDRMRHRVFALDPDAQRKWGEAMERLGERLEKFDWEGLAHPLGEMRLEGLDWKMPVLPPIEEFHFEMDSLHVRPFARVEPPYELGLELTCGFFCGWQRGEGGEAVWRGEHPPKVARVVDEGPADRAGIRQGDVLLLLDGHSFVGEEGGRALGRLGPGRSMTLQYLKGGETLTTTTITPRAPTTP
ncbi:MAG: PDZ domain-containing protein [Gemmatimonadota bacterium]